MRLLRERPIVKRLDAIPQAAAELLRLGRGGGGGVGNVGSAHALN